MFLEKRFVRMMDQVRKDHPVPLSLELWNGQHVDLSSHPTVKVTIPKPSALRYFIAPDLGKLGEAFVEGHIRVEGSIQDIFGVGESLARNSAPARGPRLPKLHSRGRDREAIQYHYDVSNEFYSLFLDANMVYSCAYYRREDDSLDAAQAHKLDHILDKLMLKPGEHFLDIGCGWGALILRAAQKYGAVATGVTLSRNQFEFARERIRAAGLEDRCRVELLDYRDLPGSGVYDKIASVGMFEHVGLKHLPEYFGKINTLLKDGGLVLNHGITTSDVDSRWMGLRAGEFIDRYVFPDGELPHVALAMKEIAAAGLEVLDVESLRRHYARTCDTWSRNLDLQRERAVAIAGEKRLRIWQIYLAGCAFGFAHGWMNLYQILAAKAPEGALGDLPMTREYMYRDEGSGPTTPA